jgi:hypothetical protein
VNGRGADPSSLGEPQVDALPTNWRRLGAPSYYAANAQVLISGNDGSLLFTRPRPAVSPNGKLTSAPLQDPVALIAMSVADLKGLSKAAADVIRQLEQQNPETGLNSTPSGDSVSEPAPNSTARADVLPADGGEPVACSPTIPPKRRRALQERLIRFKRTLIPTVVGRGVFKAVALLGAFALILAVWFWDASLLTMAADENLRLMKAVTRILPLDSTSNVESALRTYGADRALLLIEAVAVAKLIMLSLAFSFRRFCR